MRIIIVGGSNSVTMTEEAFKQLAADLMLDLETLKKALSVAIEPMAVAYREIVKAFSLVHKECKDYFEKEPMIKTTYMLPRYRYIPDKRRHHCMTRRTC